MKARRMPELLKSLYHHVISQFLSPLAFLSLSLSLSLPFSWSLFHNTQPLTLILVAGMFVSRASWEATSVLGQLSPK